MQVKLKKFSVGADGFVYATVFHIRSDNHPTLRFENTPENVDWLQKVLVEDRDLFEEGKFDLPPGMESDSEASCQEKEDD